MRCAITEAESSTVFANAFTIIFCETPILKLPVISLLKTNRSSCVHLLPASIINFFLQLHLAFSIANKFFQIIRKALSLGFCYFWFQEAIMQCFSKITNCMITFCQIAMQGSCNFNAPFAQECGVYDSPWSSAAEDRNYPNFIFIWCNCKIINKCFSVFHWFLWKNLIHVTNVVQIIASPESLH